MTLADKTVRELLAAFSSSDPTPGGGSASALASAIGASLLVMVASLPKTRSGSDEAKTALAASVRALTGLGQQLTEAIDGDAAAYGRVVAAYRLPKASAEEQLARKAAIQDALCAATDVPLSVMRLSAVALEEAAAIAAHGHRGAASDVGVALALLRAGLQGARLNVEINLGGNKDEGYTQAIRTQMASHAKRAADAARAADEALALVP
jgi:formiminotetrahydrofolate cyclodeaminase